MKTRTLFGLSGAAGAVWMMIMTPVPARADLFGITDSAMLVQIIKEVVLLQGIFNNSLRIISMTTQMARNLHSKQFYKAFGMGVADFETHGLASQAMLWGSAANGSVGLGTSGWNAASLPASVPTVPVRQGTPLAGRLATSSIYDSSGSAALNTIGQARVSLHQTQPALTAIELDALSNNPAENGEVQVLNTIQGATLADARINEIGTSATVVAAEQLTAQSKMWSDVVRESNNANIDFFAAQQTGRVGSMSQSLQREGR